MNRTQFILLNLVGGACALLIVGDLALGFLNVRLNRSVMVTQNQFGQARQVQNTAQNLVVRIAQAGQTDPALRELLLTHDFKVNLDTNTPTKPSP